MNYKEEYNKLIDAMNELLKIQNPLLKEVIDSIVNNDFLKAYEKLDSCIIETDNYLNALNKVKTTMQQLKDLGKPLPELKQNKAVSCSYTEPQENMTCSTCANACRLQEEDMEYIICNICNQAVSANKAGYSNDQIMDVYSVHPEGHCKQHVFAEELNDFDSLISDTESDNS